MVTSVLQCDAVENYRRERIRSEQRELTLMLIAYGDDSADERQERVFAAGAVVARREEWDDILPTWLKQNPMERPFHAKNCDSDRGDFKGRTHEENKQLYFDNVHLFVKSRRLFGAGVAISVRDYWDLFPFAPEDRFWPYYMCFAGVLASICRIAQLSIPPERIKVTFDNDPAKKIDSRIYEFVAKQPGSLAACLDDGMDFRNHRTQAELQVADLIARETMKDLDNRIGPKRRWPRQSLIELKRSKRFDTVLYDRQKLEEHKAIADKLHANPENSSVFRNWLDTNGIKDSVHTRLRFIVEGRNRQAESARRFRLPRR